MNNDVPHRYAGEFVALILSPVFADIERNPQTEFRTEKEQVRDHGIFFNDVSETTHSAVGSDYGGPCFSIVAGLVNVRIHVSECVPIECGISGRRIIETGFDPGDPGKLWKIWHV